MLTQSKSGKNYIKLKDSEILLPPKVLGNFVICLSRKGNILVFDKDECKMLSHGGRGSILIKLEKDEELLTVQPVKKFSSAIVSGANDRARIGVVTISSPRMARYVAKMGVRGENLGLNFKPELLEIRTKPENTTL
jgi:DNA gyrase/topoisomerase IV subunit A